MACLRSPLPPPTHGHAKQELKKFLGAVAAAPRPTAEHSFRKSCLPAGNNNCGNPAKGIFKDHTDTVKSPSTAVGKHFQERSVLGSVCSYLSHGNFQPFPSWQENPAGNAAHVPEERAAFPCSAREPNHRQTLSRLPGQSASGSHMQSSLLSLKNGLQK